MPTRFAGWRGLAGGIVANAVEGFSASPESLMVYLGPAIGQAHFEVGVEVLEAFYDSARSEAHIEAVGKAFRPSLSGPLKFYADLYGLARAELFELGVKQVFGGGFCTYEDDRRFYSYRREGETGRQVALIWRQGD